MTLSEAYVKAKGIVPAHFTAARRVVKRHLTTGKQNDFVRASLTVNQKERLERRQAPKIERALVGIGDRIVSQMVADGSLAKFMKRWEGRQYARD